MGAALVAMGADGSTTPTGTTAAAAGGSDRSKALLAAIKAGDTKTEKDKASDTKGTTSSTGAISGNVIGVGANPIVTALQEQQGIALQQLTCLQILAAKYGYTASVMDVTASGATPSTPANSSTNRSPLAFLRKKCPEIHPTSHTRASDSRLPSALDHCPGIRNPSPRLQLLAHPLHQDSSPRRTRRVFRHRRRTRPTRNRRRPHDLKLRRELTLSKRLPTTRATAWRVSVSPDPNISTKNAELLPDTTPLKNLTQARRAIPKK
jgi:hypothetical protein